MSEDGFMIHYGPEWQNTQTGIEELADYQMIYGQENSPKPPYMYTSYTVYEADTDKQHYSFVSH